MRKSLTYGSVRGASSNGRVYLDSRNRADRSEDRMMVAERPKWLVWASPSVARPEVDWKTEKRSRVFVYISSLRRKPHTENQFGDQASNRNNL